MKKIDLDSNKTATKRGWSCFSSFHQQFIMKKKKKETELKSSMFT